MCTSESCPSPGPSLPKGKIGPIWLIAWIPGKKQNAKNHRALSENEKSNRARRNPLCTPINSAGKVFGHSRRRRGDTTPGTKKWVITSPALGMNTLMRKRTKGLLFAFWLCVKDGECFLRAFCCLLNQAGLRVSCLELVKDVRCPTSGQG